jgi:hypothetical protein
MNKNNACMGFIFNKVTNFFCMVDMAVIEHKNAAGPRIWVGEW